MDNTDKMVNRIKFFQSNSKAPDTEKTIYKIFHKYAKKMAVRTNAPNLVDFDAVKDVLLEAISEAIQK